MKADRNLRVFLQKRTNDEPNVDILDDDGLSSNPIEKYVEQMKLSESEKNVGHTPTLKSELHPEDHGQDVKHTENHVTGQVISTSC